MNCLAGLVVRQQIATAAGLQTVAAVGAFPVSGQRQVALARNGHAEGSVSKHFNTHQFSGRAADILPHYGIVNLLDLPQVQFTGQHHNIGPLCVKTQRFYVGNA